MPIVARFTNPTDAEFFAAMLDEQGILVTLVDESTKESDDAHLAPVGVAVDDKNIARALEVYDTYAQNFAENTQKVEDAHPGKGFPFRKVWLVSTLLSWVALAAWIIFGFTFTATDGLLVVLPIVVFLVGILFGLLLATACAFWRMIIKTYGAKK